VECLLWACASLPPLQQCLLQRAVTPPPPPRARARAFALSPLLRYHELAGRAGDGLTATPQHFNDNCTLAGAWIIGDSGGDTVEITTGEGGVVNMTVLRCENCAFTEAHGSVVMPTITLVASGKGVWILEKGTVSPDGCVITWVSHNTSHIGSWPPFTKQGHAPAPPPPPNAGICAKMLETGHYGPWV
jgi:hypothetical protein